MAPVNFENQTTPLNRGLLIVKILKIVNSKLFRGQNASKTPNPGNSGGLESRITLAPTD